MADQEKTLEEELADEGIVASYIWKPNRVYVNNGSEYVPVDVVSDGSAQAILDAITRAGNLNLESINTTGNAQLSKLTEQEEAYTAVKANLIQTYTRMKSYFDRHGIISLSTMMSTAIGLLNDL